VNNRLTEVIFSGLKRCFYYNNSKELETPMATRLAHTQVPINDVIARRWSGRAFDPLKPVKREQLVGLIEAARWAASCYNDQPWRFLVWDRNTDAASWQKAFGCLGEWNQKWVINAPVLMLSCAGSVFERNGKPSRWGQHDTGAAGQNLYLQATAMGLMAHPMGGYDPDKARAAFAIPTDYTPMAMIAIGHPGPADSLEQEYREAETAARSRKLLTECFFEGGWGVPVRTS
jgi:nitroreductase